MPQITVGWEKDWKRFWDEGEALVREEHEEVRESQGRLEPHLPDSNALETLHSLSYLHIVGFRVNGELGAYKTWMKQPNLESMGMEVVVGGATFARKRWGRYAPAWRMMAFAMGEFATLAPIRVIDRHPMHGRACGLAALYKRYHLRPNAIEYTLFLGSP